MKGSSLSLVRNPHQIQKYIPTPQAAQIITSYFVFNNFQDFNTWQQIAKAKVEYEYTDNQKNSFNCKVTLKWEEKFYPIIVESASAKSKKNAKKKALRKLVESIIYQGMIGHGFKDDNFLEKLPKRRKNQTQSSEEQDESEIDTAILQIRKRLNANEIQSAFELFQCKQFWNYSLQRSNIEIACRVLCMLTGSQTQSMLTQSNYQFQPQLRPKQVPYMKQSKNLFQEDLTDFIRYYQLQQSQNSKISEEKKQETFKAKQDHSIKANLLPTETLFSQIHSLPPSKQDMIKYFYPIQGRKIFLKAAKCAGKDYFKEFEDIAMPNFELVNFCLNWRTIQELYNSILFYAQKYQFCIKILSILENTISSVKIHSQGSVIESKYKEKGEIYYLKNKNLLTAQFLQIIHQKINQNNLSIEGMLSNLKPQENAYAFSSKQPQEILIKKINKKYNSNEFEELFEISSNQYVLLVSKLNNEQKYIGYVKEISPQMKLIVPELCLQDEEPQPFTLYKICNGKIFEKTSSAILQASRSCMSLFEDHTTLIWQPPTYPYLTIFAQLINQWLSCKASVLIISLNAERIHQQLMGIGLKSIRIVPKMEEKNISKYNIVISTPNAVCTEILKNSAFNRIIIDEAHQICQILSLLSIVKDCKQLYLIGDPYMPRSTIYSKYSEKRQMQVSLFERLIQKKQSMTFTSKIQICYGDRSIMGWINQHIYKNSLLLSQKLNMTPMIKGFPWPSQQHRVCLLHLKSNQSQSSQDRSHIYLNNQAFFCSFIVSSILKSGFTELDQIVCSTATQQIRYLLIKHMIDMLKEFPEKVDQKNFHKQMDKLVRIADGSRYARNDLSILMLTDGSADLRLLNAALSSANRGIVIVGDMLSAREGQWHSFVSWAIKNKLVMIAQL